MATFRGFGIALAVAVVALVLGYLRGGPAAVVLLLVLGLLEVSLSFDNAVVNAAVLARMSLFWQQMFLTVGILVAVFGARLLLPLAIVWATAGMDPGRVLALALHPPSRGALEFDGDTARYANLIAEAHPKIAAFGGMFLLMLFLDFAFHDRDVKWLTYVEIPLARVGRLGQSPVVVAAGVLVTVATWLTHSRDHCAAVLTAGVLGLVAYLVVDGLSTAFRPPGAGEVPRSAPAAGKAGFVSFVYLEVLDAAFSFDGVTGAFAITSDPVIIVLGLGVIGAVFVRPITIGLVRRAALQRYVYLEHGAHWVIGALAVILLLSVDPRFQVPEVVTALVGAVVVGAAFAGSVRRNRRAAPATGLPTPVTTG
ncbi:DUF475 domain-containing protein [Mycobacterium sp.]|uniref:DUF475 domain-containing protein n=1 Tax=Mycobacterium sp. TaxID=1785 RepID=UPI0031D5F28B